MKSFLKKTDKSSESKTPEKSSAGKKAGSKQPANKDNSQKTAVKEIPVTKSKECLMKCKHKAKDKKDGKKKPDNVLHRIFMKNEQPKKISFGSSLLNLNAIIEKKNTHARRQKLLTSIASDQNLANFDEIERRVLRERSIGRKKGSSRSNSTEIRQNHVVSEKCKLDEQVSDVRDITSEKFRDFEENDVRKDGQDVKNNQITCPGKLNFDMRKVERKKHHQNTANTASNSDSNPIIVESRNSILEPREESESQNLEDVLDGTRSQQKLSELRASNEEIFQKTALIFSRIGSECKQSSLEPEYKENEDENIKVVISCNEQHLIIPVNNTNPTFEGAESKLSQTKYEGTKNLVEPEHEKNEGENTTNFDNIITPMNISQPNSIDENKNSYLRSYHKRQQRNSPQESLIFKLQNGHSNHLLDFLKGNNLPSALEDRKRLVTDTIESIISKEIPSSKAEVTGKETTSLQQPGLCNHGRSHTLQKPVMIKFQNIDSDYHSQDFERKSSSKTLQSHQSESLEIDNDLDSCAEDNEGITNIQHNLNVECLVLETALESTRGKSTTRVNEIETGIPNGDFNNVSCMNSENVSRAVSKSLEDAINYPRNLSHSRKPIISDSILRSSEKGGSKRDQYLENRFHKIIPTQSKERNYFSDPLSKQVYGDGLTNLPSAPRVIRDEITYLERFSSKNSIPWVPSELRDRPVSAEKVSTRHFAERDAHEIELVTNFVDYFDHKPPTESPNQHVKSFELLNPFQNLEELFQPCYKELITPRDTSQPCIVVYNDKNFNFSPQALIEKVIKMGEKSSGREVDIGLSDTFLDEIRDVCQEVFEAKMRDLQKRTIATERRGEIFTGADCGGDNDGIVPGKEIKSSDSSKRRHDNNKKRSSENSKTSLDQKTEISLSNHKFHIEAPNQSKIITENGTRIKSDARVPLKDSGSTYQEEKIAAVNCSKNQIQDDNSKDLRLTKVEPALDTAENLNDNRQNENLGDCLGARGNAKVICHKPELTGEGLNSTPRSERKKSIVRFDCSDEQPDDTEGNLITDTICSSEHGGTLKRKFSYDHWVTIRKRKVDNHLLKEAKLSRRSSVPSLPKKPKNSSCNCDGWIFDSLDSKSQNLSPIISSPSDSGQQNNVLHRNKKLSLSKSSLRERRELNSIDTTTKKLNLELKFETNIQNESENSDKIFPEDHANKQSQPIYETVENMESNKYLNKILKTGDSSADECSLNCTDAVLPIENVSLNLNVKQNQCSDSCAQTSRTLISEKSELTSEGTPSTPPTNGAGKSVKNKTQNNIKKKNIQIKNGDVITTRFGTEVICRRESKQSILSATEGVLKVPAAHTKKKQNVTVLFEEVLPPPSKRKNVRSFNINDFGAQSPPTKLDVKKKLPLVFSSMQSSFKLQILPPVTKRQDFLNKLVKESTSPAYLNPLKAPQDKLDSFVITPPKKAPLRNEISRSRSPLGNMANSDNLGVLKKKGREIQEPETCSSNTVGDNATSQSVKTPKSRKILNKKMNTSNDEHADCTELYIRLGQQFKSGKRFHTDDVITDSESVCVSSVKSRKSVTSSVCGNCGSCADDSYYTTNDSTIDSKDSDLEQFFRALRMKSIKCESEGHICTTDSSNLMLTHRTASSFHILSNVNIFRQSSRDTCVACEAAKLEENNHKSNTPRGICNTPEKKMKKKQDSKHTVHFEPNFTANKTDLKSINPVQNCTSFIFQQTSDLHIIQQHAMRVKSAPSMSNSADQKTGGEINGKELVSGIKITSVGHKSLFKNPSSMHVSRSFSYCPSFDGAQTSKGRGKIEHDKFDANSMLVFPATGSPARVYINTPGMYQLHLFVPTAEEAHVPEKKETERTKQYDRFATYY
ncbi:uncharacterized protein [Bemisia tabaci]|uniref:uncharacterized protein n=1 Tax=Bemisia tabaci TaxID=7038 RepID=UPI003B27F1F9